MMKVQIFAIFNCTEYNYTAFHKLDLNDYSSLILFHASYHTFIPVPAFHPLKKLEPKKLPPGHNAGGQLIYSAAYRWIGSIR